VPDRAVLTKKCSRNLRYLYDAAKAFERETGEMPSWLSDLVPKYVSDIRRLTCPKARYTGEAEELALADPALPCSYAYELCPAPLGEGVPAAPETTRREWKTRQAALVGPSVPLIRCRHHNPVLNISMCGDLFESPPLWELLHTNRFSLEQLSAAKMFGSPALTHNVSPDTPTLLIPRREDQAPPGAIDLTAYYNASLEDSWHTGAGNDLSTLGAGLKRLNGIVYDVRGIVQLLGNRAELSQYPRTASGIRIGGRCRRLHFLHSAVFGDPADEGKRVGSYIVHFTSTATYLEIPLVYGRHLRDWHYAPEEPESGPELKIAWVGENQVSRRTGRPLRLFTTTWTNLLPDLEVAAVDFISDGGSCAPFLLAITVE
jgi:hypothetical protein